MEIMAIQTMVIRTMAIRTMAIIITAMVITAAYAPLVPVVTMVDGRVMDATTIPIIHTIRTIPIIIHPINKEQFEKRYSDLSIG